MYKDAFQNEETLITSQPRAYFVDDVWLSAGASLIQIRNYAAESESTELLAALDDVRVTLKTAHEEFQEMLTATDDLNYFGQTRRAKPMAKVPFQPKTEFVKLKCAQPTVRHRPLP